jgi:hypothetical protein
MTLGYRPRGPSSCAGNKRAVLNKVERHNEMEPHVFRSVLVVLVIVSAASPTHNGDVVDSAEETHCVVVVVDQRESGEFVLSEPECFRSTGEADEWAASAEPAALVQHGETESKPILQMSTSTLGRHFDGFNGTGSSISVIGANCTGGWWNTGPTWANRISSSYNGCARLRHWDLPNKEGMFEDTVGAGTTKNLSFMNNRTESVSYHGS